jgi:hypothetical protein
MKEERGNPKTVVPETIQFESNVGLRALRNARKAEKEAKAKRKVPK